MRPAAAPWPAAPGARSSRRSTAAVVGSIGGLRPGEHRRLMAVGADDQRDLWPPAPRARRRPDGAAAGRRRRSARRPGSASGRGALQLDRPAARRSLRCGSALTSSIADAESAQERVRPSGPHLPVGDQRQRRTLRDGAVEQALGGRAGQQREHRRRHPPTRRTPSPGRGRRRTLRCSPGSSAARRAGRAAQVVVETVAEVAELESAENPDPVGDVDHHHVAVGRQPGAVVELKLARAVTRTPRRESTPSPAARPPVSGDHTVSVRHASSRTFGSSRPPPTNDLLCGGSGPCSTRVADPRPRLQRARAPGTAARRRAARHRAHRARLRRRPRSCRAESPESVCTTVGMSGNNCHARIVVCKAETRLGPGGGCRHADGVVGTMTFSEGMQIDTSTTSSSGGGRGPRPRNGNRRRPRRTAHRGGRAVARAWIRAP